MSLFDRLISRGTGEQKGKPFLSNPHTKLVSELDSAIKKAKEQYQGDAATIDAFAHALKEHYKARCKETTEDQPPMKAEARFFLSEDRMSAFGCLLPPRNGGDGMTPEEFLEDLRYEGICYGVLEDEIRQGLGDGYFHIFPVARGRLPQSGEDGKVTELFRRRKNMHIEVQNENEVDFGQEIPLQPIRKGTPVCLIRPLREGTDGTDVTGQILPSPPVADAQIPQGENTETGKGGQALLASVDGILYIENDLFCIHEQKVIDGNLDQFQGKLQISGNLYVDGDVDGGVDVTASGDIVITGKIGQARVESTGGTIRVQQGVNGTQGKTTLLAARQIQSPVIERADVHAGASIIAETIANSTVRSGGLVYVMSGRGMILDSHIQAEDSVLCLRVGNLAGGRSRFSVGYPLDVPESWKKLKDELAGVQSSIEKLWELIGGLRKKGFRITEEEKVLLEQLVEQRGLYSEKRDALTAELKCFDQVLDKRSKGRVRCEKLFPTLEVQIGKLTEEITTAEENCNIHIIDNKIILK